MLVSEKQLSSEQSRMVATTVREEIARLQRLGVEFYTDVIVGRTITVDELFEEGYEAVFVGTGAGAAAPSGTSLRFPKRIEPTTTTMNENPPIAARTPERPLRPSIR